MLARMDKIIISEITPSSIKKDDFGNRKAYLSISITNNFHFSKNVKSQVEFMEKNFSRFVIVIGDHLCRHNRLIDSNLNEEEHIKECLLKGKLIKNNYSKFLKNKNDIIHWKDLYSTQTFEKNILLVKNEYKHNHNFQKSIINSAEKFIERKEKRMELNKTINLNDAISLSISYVLEELAIMNMMIEDDFIIQSYLGSNIQILKQLANNSFSTDLLLNKGIYLDLKIKK